MLQNEGSQLVKLTVRPMVGAYHLSWTGGQYTTRLDREELRQVLKRIAAKDAETEPRSVKNRTYAQMIDGFHGGTPNHCWVWKHKLSNILDHIKAIQATTPLAEDVTVSPFEIGNIAKIHKTTPDEIKKLIPKAARLASEEFGKPPTAFGKTENDYVIECLHSFFEQEKPQMRNIDLKDFLESDLPASKYIEDVTSTSIPGISTLPIHAADLNDQRPHNPADDADLAIATAEESLEIKDVGGDRDLPDTGSGTST